MSGTFEVDFIGLALVFLAAFVGAVISHKMRQSMIVGYIILGVVLGLVAVTYPDQVGFHIFLDTDHHTFLEPSRELDVGDRELHPPLELLSDLGLTFLLFFIGLEFSVAKLRRAGKPSLVIAITHLSFNMFAGALIGATFGWDLKSTFFLAATLSMSSLGVAAKSLIELRRLDREETEYMLGSMIVEDFMTMVILTLAMGTVAAETVASDAPGSALLESVKGALIVYAVFIALALFLMPRLSRYIERVKSDEVFTLLALACVLGSAALAFYYGLPFMIGAFFIGMAFSETRISERLQLRLLSFRDAFVAIFFVAFGLQINLGTLSTAVGPILMGLGMVIINELLLVGSVAYLLGFNARASASLGASLLGRGGDSILFASIGGSLTKADGTTKLLPKAEQLYPFSGGIALVTNFLVPVMIRKSVAFSRALSLHLPRRMVFTGAAIGQAVRPSIMHRHGREERRNLSLTVLPVLLVAASLASALSAVIQQQLWTLAAAGVAVVLLVAQYRPLARLMTENLSGADFSALGFRLKHHRAVAGFAPLGATLLLTIPVVVASTWTFDWRLSGPAALVVVGIVLALGARTYSKAVGTHGHGAAKRHVSRHLTDQKHRMKERYRRT